MKTAIQSPLHFVPVSKSSPSFRFCSVWLVFLLYVPSVFKLVVSFGDYQISPYFFVLRLMQAGALSGVFHEG